MPTLCPALSRAEIRRTLPSQGSEPNKNRTVLLGGHWRKGKGTQCKNLEKDHRPRDGEWENDGEQIRGRQGRGKDLDNTCI
jgi:hypothetical protein